MSRLPVFDVWDTDLAQEAIQSVYKLDKVSLECIDTVMYTSSYCNKNRFFNYPFAMCGSQNDSLFFGNFDEIKSIAKENKQNFIIKTLSNHPEHLRVHAANCPILELEEPRSKYRSKFRNQLNRHGRQANDLGVYFERTTAANDLLSFYTNVLAKVYRDKHKMLFQPYDLLRRLFEKGGARLYVARKNKNIIGGVFCCSSTNVIHYNWGAMLECGSLSIGGLLLDHAINDAAKEGYKWFDFGATPLSHYKLLQFKTRFGADVYPIYHYFTGVEPVITDYNSAFPLIRNIYSHVPLKVLMLFMPYVVPLFVE